MKTLILSFMIILLVPLGVSAGDHSHEHDGHAHEHDDEGFIDHGSHVHGYVEANISNFEETINLEFIFPAKDIFGFEHEPRNEAQQAIVAKQLELVRDADRVFLFNPICKLIDTRLESKLETHHDHVGSEHEEGHHDHAENKHEEEHHDHAEDGYEEEVHSDVFVKYVMKCSDDKDMKITFNLFKTFPTVEALKVRYVSEKGQDTVKLTPDQNSFAIP